MNQMSWGDILNVLVSAVVSGAIVGFGAYQVSGHTKGALSAAALAGVAAAIAHLRDSPKA